MDQHPYDPYDHMIPLGFFNVLKIAFVNFYNFASFFIVIYGQEKFFRSLLQHLYLRHLLAYFFFNPSDFIKSDSKEIGKMKAMPLFSLIFLVLEDIIKNFFRLNFMRGIPVLLFVLVTSY